MAKKSVVVLGAGFGGLQAAMRIARKLQALKLLETYEVVLIDRSDCHLFTPLLYKIAASPDTSRDTCTYDTSSLVAHFPIRFVEDEIMAIDVINGAVRLKAGGDLHADYLVIALGAETNYFGIPGLQENSLQLKTVESAMQIRDAVAKAFAKGGDVAIVAGGGGPNGIELAAELRHWANIAGEGNPNLNVSISIIEAMPTILPGFDRTAAAHALIRLEKLGIAIKTNAKITAVSTNEIAIEGADKIPFDIFIWTGGIRTPDIVTGAPLEKEPHGKPLAKSDMACAPGTPDLKLAPMVYGLGDSVCFMNPKTGKPVPALARAAILQARVAAENIIEEIKQSELKNYHAKLTSFTPGNYPYVIPVGDNWSIAKFGPFVFWGWPGAMFQKLVALHYLVSIMPFDEAFKAWKRM